MGHIGFSYVGLVYLLMLMIPNLIWTGKRPAGYTSDNENGILRLFERIGQVCVVCTVLIFSDFNLRPWSLWSVWLLLSFFAMVLYECWWIRYFRSKRTLGDFYSRFAGVPAAGATLPITAFFLLGIYGKVIWLIVSVILLGIGHIGIHLQHRRELDNPR